MDCTLMEKPTLRPETHELLEKIAELEAEQSRLDNNLATMCHDLKTPLTSIKLFADILLSQRDEIDAESQARYLVLISSEAERMSRLITNTTDLQRLASGRATWQDEKRDIAKLVAACIKPLRQWCAAKGIEFIYETNIESLPMTLDANRFMRLLAGLLGNALRFTEKGAIEMKLHRLGDLVSLTVRDNGSGIAEEQLQALGRPHTEAGPLSKDIGFTFASTVVHHHHGRIWGENTPHGSVFHIELPLRELPPPSER